MHVAVEATHLLHELRGIGRYVRALLPRMAAARPDLRFTLFTKSQSDAGALSLALARDGVLDGRHRFAPVSRLRTTPADVYWFPWNFIRPIPTRGPIVVTIHDIVPLVLPDRRWTAWQSRLRWRRRFAATARHATLILADSSFTASEVTRVLQVPSERIRIVLLGAEHFIPPAAVDDASVLERLSVREPFFLVVGSDEPRKNLPVVYRAMARFVASGGKATLVHAGPPHRGESARAGPAPWMHEVGYVTDADLAVLYRHTAALIVASTYEGFGLPVLEAMVSGAPVACAHATSLPEVAGDAVAYFEPHDDAGLASILSRMLADAPFRVTLAAAGSARARTFCWDDTARATLAVFDEARRFR